MTASYDVLVIGGGPVGLTMALALARSVAGVRIAVLDRRPLPGRGDGRASAISAAARRLFVALEVWDGMAAMAEPVRAMNITDSGTGDIARPLFLRFEGEIEGNEPFAHMVPNTSLVAALANGLGGQAEFIAPVEVTRFAPGPGEAVIGLGDGRTLSAPLVIAADGARSALRDMAGIGVIARDYRQTGLVTTIGHELDHNGVAYEHFRPAGPFASLPLPGRRSSLVWTESADEADRLLSLAPERLAEDIEAAMGSTLGGVTVGEPLVAFPLRLQLARALVAPRLALIGDAAHVIHPIAGQGLNLGLKDVAALAEAVVDAMRLGEDHGRDEVLARFQAWRRLDTALMAAMTDSLNRLFSNDSAALRAVRDLGLSLVERMPRLKDGFIAAAAGVPSGGPRLLSGRPL